MSIVLMWPEEFSVHLVLFVIPKVGGHQVPAVWADKYITEYTAKE